MSHEGVASNELEFAVHCMIVFQFVSYTDAQTFRQRVRAVEGLKHNIYGAYRPSHGKKMVSSTRFNSHSHGPNFPTSKVSPLNYDICDYRG